MHTSPNNNTTQEQTSNNTSNNNNTHKEYGEESTITTTTTTTTICTQCKKILIPFTKGPIPLRKSNDGNILANSLDKLQISESTPNLSHGLCRTCYNNINTDLLASAHTENINNNTENDNDNNNNNNFNARKTILSKSLSSPQLSRHLPSRPKRVLIVDDNSLQRQIHKRIIEHLGYECDVAIGGAQALELVQKHNYSFILMDLIMAPMDGWTTSKNIKSFLLQSQGFSSSSPKIIAVTGLNVDEKLMKQCKDSGMEDVLHKPISTVMLNKVFHKNSSTTKLDR